MKINNKEFTYKVTRTDMFKLAKIISSLGVNPKVDNMNESDIAMALFTELINNLDKAETETLAWISKIYNVSPEEIEEIGFTAELALWWNVYDSEKAFFTKLLQSRSKEQKKAVLHMN